VAFAFNNANSPGYARSFRAPEQLADTNIYRAAEPSVEPGQMAYRVNQRFAGSDYRPRRPSAVTPKNTPITSSIVLGSGTAWK